MTQAPTIPRSDEWQMRPIWRHNPWRRLSRRRRWALAGAVVLSLALLGRAVFTHQVVNADTLEIRHLTVLRAEGDTTGISEIDNALGTEYRLDYHRNGAFLAEFELRNTGSREITVEAVIPERYYYFRIEEVLLSTGDRAGTPGPYGRFRSFDLPAGDSRFLRVVFRFPDCDLASTPTRHVVRELPVAYRIAGQRRSPQVEIVEGALSVMATGTCDYAYPSGVAP